jgi:Spy/CpxP family protein refolding chaperone
MNPLTRKAAVFYLVATFIVGAAAGLAVGYSADRRPKAPKFDPAGIKRKIFADLTRDLQLSDDQQRQLEPIIQLNMDDFGLCQRENMARVHESMKKGRERISAILTAEQREKFEAREREREKKFREREHRGPGGPPPTPPQTAK